MLSIISSKTEIQKNRHYYVRRKKKVAKEEVEKVEDVATEKVVDEEPKSKRKSF